ncbi:unnamed protein product [Amoebophrya sp. A120]|nr:unnamed protein product [Amoebophrya sp. A120]|eukprot:GSA120T00005852001.1
MYVAGTPEWKLPSISVEQLKSQAPQQVSAAQIKLNYGLVYFTSSLGFYALWASFHDIGLSTLLTFSVLIQSLALVCLLTAILTRRSVVGISALSIGMQALSFFLRLGSTCWLRGYIPVDSTGDCLYQLADVFAFSVCCLIVYLCTHKFKSTYDESCDQFPVYPTVIGCLIAAALVHPDLNNRPFFDGLWASSLYVDVMSTMPQLYMIHKQEGKVDALSAHYVFLVAVSRAMDTVFWYFGFEELAPENGGFNISGCTVLGANLLHMALISDFVYSYVKNVLAGKVMHRQFDFASNEKVVLDVV